MKSEKKKNQAGKISEWIKLDLNASTGLLSSLDKLILHLQAVLPDDRFDGIDHYTNIMISIYNHIKSSDTKNRRISVKQLKAIQQGYYRSFSEDLYIPGLEFYLIRNTELIHRQQKSYQTRLERGSIVGPNTNSKE